jgi:hypothetical protein
MEMISPSHGGYSATGESVSVFHWIEDWVNPRDMMMKGKAFKEK